MLIHDISVRIDPTIVVWPGQPGVEMRHLSHLSKGDAATVTHLSLSAHTGTHVDAPNHFMPDQEGVDQIDLNTVVGPALVVDVPDVVEISADIFEALAIPSGTERLLIRTGSSRLWEEGHTSFFEDYAGVTRSGAQWLVDHGVKLIGVDYLSVALYRDTAAPHRILLGAKVVILEGLNLTRIAPGIYDLVCLPLKLAGCDGSPVRAILIERE